MKIEVSEASEQELKELLKVLIALKFDPKRRYECYAHTALINLISAAKDAYINAAGLNRYNSEFRRDRIPREDKEGIAYVARLIRDSSGEADLETIDVLAQPMILSEKTKKEILGLSYSPKFGD